MATIHMSVETILFSLAGFAARPVAEKLWHKIKEVREKKQENAIYGQIKTKSPKVDGVGAPWFEQGKYCQAFRGDEVPAKVEFGPNRLTGNVVVPIHNIDEKPQVQAVAGMLLIGIPYQAEIHLETGDSFAAKDFGYLQLSFGSPVVVNPKDVDVSSKGLAIPVGFLAPAQAAQVVTPSQPASAPNQSKEVEMRFGRKVDAEIPILP